MFPSSPKANVLGAVPERIANARVQDRRLPAWRRFLQPSTLSVFGLALAVTLWGFNYKLSLYQPHRDTAARTVVAKLWVDQRHATSAADVQQRTKTQRYGSSDTIRTPLHSVVPIQVPALAAPAHTGPAWFLRSLVPLRSPPSGFLSA